MMRTSAIIINAVLLVAPGTRAQDGTATQPATRQALAIVPFKVLSDIGIENAGEVVADLLSTRIDLARFDLLERQQLAAVLKEVDLSLTDIVDNPDILKGKRIKVARILVVGAVSTVGDQIHLTARMISLDEGMKTLRVAGTSVVGLQKLRTEAIADLAAQLQETEAERLERAARQALGDLRYDEALASFDQAIRAYESDVSVRDSAVLRGKLASCRLARVEAEQQMRDVEALFAKAKDALERSRADEARGFFDSLTAKVPSDSPELAALRKRLFDVENEAVDQIKGTWQGTISTGHRVYPVTIVIDSGATDLFSGTLRITGKKEPNEGVIAGAILSKAPETPQERVWWDQARGEVKAKWKVTQTLHGRLETSRWYYVGFSGNKASGAMIEERAASATYWPVQLSRERGQR